MSSAAAESPFHRPAIWPWLALVRFILAAVVVAAHLRWFFRYDPVILAAAEFGAQVAVIGFFVISGYSIRASLAQHGDGTLAFYIRRVLRIYPLYLGAVLLTHALNVAFRPALPLPGFTLGSTGWATSAGNALLLQGFACATMPFNPPLWSLSVEVFYYALAPLFLLLPRPVAVGSMALTFAYFCLPIAGVRAEFFYGYDAFRHLWAWLLGFYFAEWSRHRLGWIALTVGLGAVCLHPTSLSDRLSCVTALLVVLAFRFGARREVSDATRRRLLFLGDLSYPLYLFHVPLLTVAWTFLGIRQPALAFVWVLAGTTALLWLIDYSLTQRVLKPLATNWLRRRSAKA
ncbi:MAG: acyltransferase [Verrucomicrobia bacterium]|nr:acyltransferase [Verrucomicrobiota bacterium]